tara:strand:- start:1613 stop:2230 length:618 start_codon:yes stop_codon:yes gene_type:complete
LSTAERKATNITWHEGHVTRQQRESTLRQNGVLLWLTGLPSSGKSTIAFTAEHALADRGYHPYVLDGDNIRHGLNANLGFSAEDRAENIRRIGEVGKLFVDAGIITLTSFVSPYREDRDKVRANLDDGDFLEVFIDTPVELCEKRDPKGLYAKARAGEIPNFTGVSDPYEAPNNPELIISTSDCSPEQAASMIIELLENRDKIKS